MVIEIVLQFNFTQVVLAMNDEAFLPEVVVLTFELLHGPALHVLLMLREIPFLTRLFVEHAIRALLVAELGLLEKRLRLCLFVVI